MAGLSVVTVVRHYVRSIVETVENLRPHNLNIKEILPAHGMLQLEKPSETIEYYLKLARGEHER
uniref:MBL fold metallo-hydrolase n=1 Tax=Fervidicoccus fontis TaxID=683846 RepID=A0A7J3ZM76_9CREN